MDDLIYDMALSMDYSITPFEKIALLNKFGSSKEVLGLSLSYVKTVIGRGWTGSRFNPDLWLEKSKDFFDFIIKSGIKTVRFDMPEYPSSLKEIPDCPFMIYYRGNISYDYNKSIGVVGTRNPDDEGKKHSVNFCNMLAKKDYVIISGLAVGVDGIAHKQCVDNNKQTIAVLGSGIDKVYPALHKDLARNILDNGGGIISEYPPDFPVRKWNFPKRNRIITALSKSILVTQAPQKSGSMITAHLCADYNKDLYALEYPIYHEQNRGNQVLIENGASGVKCVNDLLEHI